MKHSKAFLIIFFPAILSLILSLIFFSIQESTLKLAVQEALLYPAFVEQFAEKLEQARKTLKKNELDEPKLFGLKMTIFGFAMLAFVFLKLLLLNY